MKGVEGERRRERRRSRRRGEGGEGMEEGYGDLGRFLSAVVILWNNWARLGAVTSVMANRTPSLCNPSVTTSGHP